MISQPRVNEEERRPRAREFLNFINERSLSKNNSSEEPGLVAAREVTHLSLKGGKYSIPMEENVEFLGLYVAAMLANDDLFLVENRTEVFPFFLDFDLLHKREVDTREIHEVYLPSIQKT